MEKKWAQRFWQQYVALLWKNVLVSWRNRRSFITRLLAPAMFLVLLLLIDFAFKSDQSQSEGFKDVKNPAGNPIGDIPACYKDLYLEPGCLDFIYSPIGNPAAEEIVQNIRDRNVPAIPADRVMGFADLKAANLWLYENQQKAAGGLHFQILSDSDMSLTLQGNHTAKFFRGNFQDPNYFSEQPLQVAAQREMVRYQAKAANAPGWQDLSFQVSWKLFAHPYLSSRSIIGDSLGLLLFAANMFSFVLTMTGIITERENKLTQALSTMGMYQSSYWASWCTWEIGIAFIIAMLTCMFGAIFQFNFFLNNSFGNTFFVIFLFQLAMVGFAFLLSCFIGKSTVAVIVGFLCFLLGFIIQIVVVFGYPYSAKWHDDYGGVVTAFFTLMPWAPFTKAINSLALATTCTPFKVQSVLGQADIAFGAIGDPFQRQNLRVQGARTPPLGVNIDEEYFELNCVFPVGELMLINMGHFFVYTLLAVYLNEVLPDSNGVRKHPFYFFFPSFWNPAGHTSSKLSTKQQPYPPTLSKDADVEAEERKMKARLAGEESADTSPSQHGAAAVQVFGMQRHFSRMSFWAIRDSWFEIKQKQLFCLLGPNGAGKSTTINVLTGVLPPTGGDALVNGESLMSPGGMASIRSRMGVCPQFDLLWNELSALEHMKLYGHIKGLQDRAVVNAEAAKLLDEVNLTYAATMRTGSYSGGMKRRLSVAVALIGDPQIVYLDEPTTGMDPISRRQVWDIIEKAKKGRAIVLTTHSMEEADILGDRIAIMARGAIRCIGSSLRLKQKFGAGYKVSISVMSPKDTDSDAARQRAERVVKHMQDSYKLQPADETKAYITYLVGPTMFGQLQGLLKSLEEQRTAFGISDIQIALTSLEEVFLNIAKAAEVESAQQNNTFVDVVLDDGFVLKVSPGAETAKDARNENVYAIQWGQGEDGALIVVKLDLQ